MNKLYFIMLHGRQSGPFTSEEMKNLNIGPDTLVWEQGLKEWTKAQDIPELKDMFVAGFSDRGNPETAKPLPYIIYPNTGKYAKYFGYELAGRTDRFLGALVEVVIFALVSWGVSYLVSEVAPLAVISEYLGFGSFISSITFSALFGAIFYPLWSGNLGHRIMGLKVISVTDGRDISSAGGGAGREALKCLMGYIIIGHIWLLWDEDKQNLYDKLCKTYVVRRQE